MSRSGRKFIAVLSIILAAASAVAFLIYKMQKEPEFRKKLLAMWTEVKELVSALASSLSGLIDRVRPAPVIPTCDMNDEDCPY